MRTTRLLSIGLAIGLLLASLAATGVLPVAAQGAEEGPAVRGAAAEGRDAQEGRAPRDPVLPNHDRTEPALTFAMVLAEHKVASPADQQAAFEAIAAAVFDSPTTLARMDRSREDGRLAFVRIWLAPFGRAAQEADQMTRSELVAVTARLVRIWIASLREMGAAAATFEARVVASTLDARLAEARLARSHANALRDAAAAGGPAADGSALARAQAEVGYDAEVMIMRADAADEVSREDLDVVLPPYDLTPAIIRAIGDGDAVATALDKG